MKNSWLITAALVGTVILVAGILHIGNLNFTWQVRGEAAALQKAARENTTPRGAYHRSPGRLHQGDLRALPAPVRAHLLYTGISGRIPVRSAMLKQKGRFRGKPDQAWMPFEARQYFTADPPAFLWFADIQAAPFVYIRGRDLYTDGEANMLIKLLSLHKIADARGRKLDQGAMLRYLSETIWFPSALLGKNIAWRALDAKSARATLTYRGEKVSGVFHFDKQGRFKRFTAKRWMVDDGKARLLDWSTEMLEYGELAGLRLPVRARAVWHPPEGDFPYIELQVTELKYDAPPGF